MEQSNRLKERYRAFPLVCFIAVAPGCEGRGPTEKEEIQTLFSEWRSGSIRESVSVTINGHTYCVDVVRNYREAKLGIAPLTARM